MLDALQMDSDTNDVSVVPLSTTSACASATSYIIPAAVQRRGPGRPPRVIAPVDTHVSLVVPVCLDVGGPALSAVTKHIPDYDSMLAEMSVWHVNYPHRDIATIVCKGTTGVEMC